MLVYVVEGYTKDEDGPYVMGVYGSPDLAEDAYREYDATENEFVTYAVRAVQMNVRATTLAGEVVNSLAKF